MDTFHTVDEPQKHYTEGKKQDTKAHLLCDSVYMREVMPEKMVKNLFFLHKSNVAEMVKINYFRTLTVNQRLVESEKHLFKKKGRIFFQ